MSLMTASRTDSPVSPISYAELTTVHRTRVMGVVNVTADSFSDGGLYLQQDAAIAHALKLVRDGADIIDVGGESTRPGATRVDPLVEAERVVPVIAALVEQGIATSVDTMRSDVAAAAIAAGVNIVNDVSGGLADPQMCAVVADSSADYVLMHWRTQAFGDAAGAHHGADVTAEVYDHLARRVEVALAAGIAEARLILDPGLGFAKTPENNWRLLRELSRLDGLGLPILIGASRKRFLTGMELSGRSGVALDRDDTTAAISALAALQRAWGVRVHHVPTAAAAVEVAARYHHAAERS